MKILTTITIGLAVSCYGADSTAIRLNSAGFRPDSIKAATITEACEGFVVKNAQTGEVVNTGKVSIPEYQRDIDQQGWIADFSSLKTEGSYYLEIPGGTRSVEFQIGPEVYKKPLITVMRGFYLWRCGCSVSGEYNGETYSHAACHMEDGYLDYTGLGTARHESLGGWHDAGDFGKYTVNGCFAAGMLFQVWDNFGDKLKDLELDLPKTDIECPDFLKELKWECDWLLTMQFPDGSGKVSHKLTTLNFCGFVMPEDEKDKRYLTDWSSAATADFAATMAMAARYFRPYSTEYADKCLKAAVLSYDFLQANPQEKSFVQGPFTTGDYNSRDWDDKLWMAVELWRTTGEDKYLKDFEARAAGAGAYWVNDYGWGQLSPLGLVSYLQADMPGRDAGLVEKLSWILVSGADDSISNSEKDIYRRVMGQRYYWGCNGSIANRSLIFWAANKILPSEKYHRAAEDVVSYLLGRNYFDRSFVTGIGLNPPMYPHDRRSAADDKSEPWPGYLVGGGERAKDWQDDQNSYQTNEIAVNWQAAMVYAMAAANCW